MIWKNHGDVGTGQTELHCILDEEELDGGNADGRGSENPTVHGNIREDNRDRSINTHTYHAFSKIFSGKRSESYFWIIVAVVGMFITIFLSAKIVAKYYRYEVVIEVTWNVTNKNPFPSITFCDIDLMVGHYFAYCGVPHGQSYDNTNITCPHDTLKEISGEQKKMNTSYKWSNGIFHVLKCFTWDGKYCTDNRYFKSTDRLNHTCFTWNWNGNLHDNFGHAYLEFTVNESYRDDNSFVFGEIHDPDVLEIGKSNSFRFEPSKSYELRIRKTMIKRLQSPFPSKCVMNMPHHIYPGRYTRRGCIDSVYYIKMLKVCGEILDYHRLHIPKEILKRYKRNRTISEALQCMIGPSAQEIDDVDIETCPIACEEMDLDATSTFYERKNNDKSKVVYSFDIQYQDLDYYKVMEEKPKYSLNDVIVGISGITCFFIGTSLLTIIEFLTYIFRRGWERFLR